MQGSGVYLQGLSTSDNGRSDYASSITFSSSSFSSRNMLYSFNSVTKAYLRGNATNSTNIMTVSSYYTGGLIN